MSAFFPDTASARPEQQKVTRLTQQPVTSLSSPDQSVALPVAKHRSKPQLPRWILVASE